jgi:pyochelin biosynthetic protein PchC
VITGETGSAGPTRVWLRRLGPVSEPWARLVCFPHAGGTAAYFRSWREHLPRDVELFSVQYPGRLDRIGEPCVDDMDLMAASVTSAVQPLMATAWVPSWRTRWPGASRSAARTR